MSSALETSAAISGIGLEVLWTGTWLWLQPTSTLSLRLLRYQAGMAPRQCRSGPARRAREQPARTHYFMKVIIRVGLEGLTGQIIRVLFVFPLLPPYRPSHLACTKVNWNFMESPYSMEAWRLRITWMTRMRRRNVRQLSATCPPPPFAGNRSADQLLESTLRVLPPRHLRALTTGRVYALQLPPLPMNRHGAPPVQKRPWPPAVPRRGAALRVSASMPKVLPMN